MLELAASLVSTPNVIPFTGAEPGGWGWSDLSGAVPDADDTPGALLALRYVIVEESKDRSRVMRAKPEWHQADAAAWRIEWLLNLQNRDGGWPTFCRGWGTLPFDRSGSDLDGARDSGGIIRLAQGDVSPVVAASNWQISDSSVDLPILADQPARRW